jgi:hypothetical protein
MSSASIDRFLAEFSVPPAGATPDWCEHVALVETLLLSLDRHARQSRDAQSTLLTINQIIQSDRCIGARAKAVLEVLMAAVDPMQHPGTGALQ